MTVPSTQFPLYSRCARRCSRCPHTTATEEWVAAATRQCQIMTRSYCSMPSTRVCWSPVVETRNRSETPHTLPVRSSCSHRLLRLTSHLFDLGSVSVQEATILQNRLCRTDIIWNYVRYIYTSSICDVPSILPYLLHPLFCPLGSDLGRCQWGPHGPYAQ